MLLALVRDLACCRSVRALRATHVISKGTGIAGQQGAGRIDIPHINQRDAVGIDIKVSDRVGAIVYLHTEHEDIGCGIWRACGAAIERVVAVLSVDQITTGPPADGLVSSPRRRRSRKMSPIRSPTPSLKALLRSP